MYMFFKKKPGCVVSVLYVAFSCVVRYLHRVEMMPSPTFLGQKLWTVQDHPFVPSVLLGPAKPENVSTAQYRNSPLATADVPQEIKGARGFYFMILHDSSVSFFISQKYIYIWVRIFIKAIKHCRKHLRLIPYCPFASEIVDRLIPIKPREYVLNKRGRRRSFNTYKRDSWPYI